MAITRVRDDIKTIQKTIKTISAIKKTPIMKKTVKKSVKVKNMEKNSETFTELSNWNAAPFSRFSNVPKNIGFEFLIHYISEKVKSTLRQYKHVKNPAIVDEVVLDMIKDYTKTNVRDMSGTHVTLYINNKEDIADFFCMQRVDMMHDFLHEKSSIEKKDLENILKNDGEFLSVVFEREIIPMNPHVPPKVLKDLWMEITYSSGNFKKITSDVLKGAYRNWEKTVFDIYSRSYENGACNRTFRRNQGIRADAGHQMILDMSVTDHLREIYNKFTPTLHIASIVDAGQYFLTENHFWKRFRYLYDARVHQRGRDHIDPMILRNIVIRKIDTLFPSRFVYGNRNERAVDGTLLPVVDTIVSKIMSDDLSSKEDNANMMKNLVDAFMHRVKMKLNEINMSKFFNNNQIIKVLFIIVQAVEKEIKKEMNNSARREKPLLYAIDLQPFSYMIRTQYKNHDICLNYVSIGPSRVKKGLDDLQVNKYTGLRIQSKPAVVKSLAFKDLVSPGDGAHGRIYTKLMQKHLGDFIPVMYALVFGRYYGTGDKMAANSYLLMHGIIERNIATHMLRVNANRSTLPKEFKTERRIFVENADGVRFFGSEECPVTVVPMRVR